MRFVATRRAGAPVMLGVLLVVAGVRGADLQPGSGSGAAGGAVTIPVTLSNPAGAVACQFEVTYDAARLIPGSATGGDAIANHRVVSSEPSPGVRRVLVYSLSNAPLKAGTVVNVPFTLARTFTSGSTPVALRNEVLADNAAARVLAAIGPPGTVTVGGGVVAPAQLGLVTVAPTGEASFEVVGTAGRSYLIQASPDLKTWTPLLPAPVPGSGRTSYTDTTSRGLPQRFYRAVSQ